MGEKITVKQRRLALGMTITQLEESTRIDKSLLSRLENNRYIPTELEKKKILRALESMQDEIVFPEAKLVYGV